MERNYDNIFKIIEGELAQRTTSGMPLRIHLWDGNHTAPEPREIFTHPRMIEITSRYGTPVLLPEIAESSSMNQAIAAHVAAPPEIRESNKAFFKAIGQAYSPKQSERYAAAFGRIFELAASGVPVFYSDPRGNSKFSFQFNAQEQAHFSKLIKTLAPMTNPSLCADVAAKKLEAHLSPNDRKSFQDFAKKFAQMALDGAADTMAVDQKIVATVTDRFADSAKQGSHIPIMLYGALHYSKTGDLDELSPGLSIQIINAPGAMRDPSGKAPDIYNDFPDYVYYINSGKIVKMDTPQAKAEALGYTLEQFLVWERAATDGKPSPDYKAPDLPPHIQQMCDKETEHLKPYVSKNKSGASYLPPVEKPKSTQHSK